MFLFHILVQDLTQAVHKRRRENPGSIPGEGRDFSVPHSVRTTSGAHSTSCPMSTRSSFPGGKAGCKADCSPPCSAELKNAWNYTSTENDWRSGNVLASYSGGVRFESRPGHRLSLLRGFSLFTCLSRQIPG
jgi:hypothetical protein